MADKGKMKQKDMQGLTIYLEPELYDEFRIILSYLDERSIDIHNQAIRLFIEKKKDEDPELEKYIKVIKKSPAFSASKKGKK